MVQILRINSTNEDFIALVKKLDAELTIIDGDEHAFYDQYNKIHDIKYAVVLYSNGIPVSCGAIKEFTAESVEVKRMYTLPEHRGKGFAVQVLNELEKWAAELGYKKCILETGKRQVDAVRLYEKSGYERIENYGQYAGVENSICFEKELEIPAERS
ncbi:MAG: GNAT family N-acetyltransferase [Chitinophagaceae bacterium]|nr:GNAT family N-acetyltransferase [Chitinophagaceae bacterium]MCB9056643.1 GNAT family N-acetyltransferase [Chitinophagales bacterium]